MKGFSFYFTSGFSLAFLFCSVVESKKMWKIWNESYFWNFWENNFTISEALLQFQMNVGFEILYKTTGVVLLLNKHLKLFRANFCFYSYLCSFSWSNKRHIKLYLVKILLHKTERSAYALLCFFSMCLIQPVHSPSCSGEHERGAFARLREMWCGDGTVSEGEDKETFWGWIWLVWGFFLVGNLLSIGWQQSELYVSRW